MALTSATIIYAELKESYFQEAAKINSLNPLASVIRKLPLFGKLLGWNSSSKNSKKTS